MVLPDDSVACLPGGPRSFFPFLNVLCAVPGAGNRAVNYTDSPALLELKSLVERTDESADDFHSV